MHCLIVWATWAVGQEILQVIEKKQVALSDISVAGSSRSAWKVIKTYLWDRTVIDSQEVDFSLYDVALFAAWSEISRLYVPKALQAWCRVIDNASLFRYEDDVPLVVPAINKETIADAPLIANPNCTTAIAAMVLWPLHQEYSIKTCIMSTYQAASGAGAAWVQELHEQLQAYPWSSKYEVFAHQLSNNLIPCIDSMQDNGYSREEMKVVREMKKIFGTDQIDVSCTAVRVPTMRTHAESITIQTAKKLNIEDVRDILRTCPWVELVDNPHQDIYPQPLTAQWKFAVEVGRLRHSLVFWEYGLDMFVCGDQLLRGAALNAVEILAELL